VAGERIGNEVARDSVNVVAGMLLLSLRQRCWVLSSGGVPYQVLGFWGGVAVVEVRAADEGEVLQGLVEWGWTGWQVASDA
jgi:hypothetical protein